MGVRGKLLALTVSIVIAFAIVLGWMRASVQSSLPVLKDNVRLGVEKLVASFLTGESEEVVVVAVGGEPEALRVRILDIKDRDPSIEFIVVYDPDGRVLANAGAAPEGFALSQAGNGVSREIGDRLLVADQQLRIEGILLATVAAGFSLEPVLQKERELSTLFTAAALVVLVALVVTVLVANRIVAQIRDQSDVIEKTALDLQSSAEAISTVALQTENNSSEEAAAVDETRRTMERLLEAAAEIARQASEVAVSAERSATASVQVAEQISRLSAHALKVEDISETIRLIAEKSDVLALNAGLEGSKAGEAGRGFVLVGAEMKRLAETVTRAAHEIKGLAVGMRDQSHAAVMATEEGQRLANETLGVSKKISMISSQQRSGTQQVTQSMDAVQDFTQHALTGARQTKDTADHLLHAAQEMADVVKQSRAVMFGSAGA